MKTKIIVLICLVIGLSFISENNISATFHSKKIAKDTYTKTEFDSIINVYVLSPIQKSLEKSDPHIFMTKCYSKLIYNVSDGAFDGQKSPEFFGTKQTYIGSIRFIECGQASTLCDFKINLSNFEVQVKESYFSQWKPLKNLLDQIEKKK